MQNGLNLQALIGQIFDRIANNDQNVFAQSRPAGAASPRAVQAGDQYGIKGPGLARGMMEDAARYRNGNTGWLPSEIKANPDVGAMGGPNDPYWKGRVPDDENLLQAIQDMMGPTDE